MGMLTPRCKLQEEARPCAIPKEEEEVGTRLLTSMYWCRQEAASSMEMGARRGLRGYRGRGILERSLLVICCSVSLVMILLGFVAYIYS